MRTRLPPLLLFCALLYSFPAPAQMTLEVIPLQFRSSDEIIPVIRPMLQQDGTITGMNNQLVIKTSPANLQEIKQILAEIDKAAKRLLITVKQDVEGAIDTQEHGVSGRYSTGDIRISSNNGAQSREGIGVSVRDENGNNLQYHNLSTRSSLDDSNTFQVQTLDGKAAYIQTGQQVPLANRNTYVTHNGVVVQDTVDYQDVSSGFYVLPRVNGNRVTLQISPQLSRVHPEQGGVFEVQSAETTTSVQFGEWLQIGGIDRSFNNSDGKNLYRTRQSGQQQRNIYLKVEEIH